MSSLLRKFSAVAVSSVFLAVGTNVASAQAYRATITEAPKFDELPSPQISSGKEKPFKPGNWLEVEAKVQIEMAPVPASKTCDTIDVIWYVAVENPDKRGGFLKLTKKISYVNIPLNQDVYVSTYLSPASLRRLAGEASPKRAVKYVGMEILVNGQNIDRNASSTDKWWTKSSERMSESQAVPLLSKPETPFNALWWDRYAEVGVEKR